MIHRCFLTAILVVMAATLPAAKPPTKNVLFIVSDDLSADLGCCGNQLVRSPHIVRLSKRGRKSPHYCSTICRA